MQIVGYCTAATFSNLYVCVCVCVHAHARVCVGRSVVSSSLQPHGL